MSEDVCNYIKRTPKPFFKRHLNKLIFGIGAYCVCISVFMIVATEAWTSLITNSEALDVFNSIWEMGFLAGASVGFGFMLLMKVDYTWIKQKVKMK